MTKKPFLPPPLIRPKNRLILPAHHSVSDWDKNADATYTLDTTQYVSAPRSLRLGGPGSTQPDTQFLCRVAPTRNLPQGAIVTSLRTTYGDGGHRIHFRNQSVLGESSFLHSYYIQYFGGDALFNIIVGGDITILGTFILNTLANTWYKDRITWWNGKTPDAEDCITVRLERWIAGEWLQQNDWLYDTVNRWYDSAVNRCGVGCDEQNDEYHWLDDTELWAPD